MTWHSGQKLTSLCAICALRVWWGLENGSLRRNLKHGAISGCAAAASMRREHCELTAIVYASHN
jgi:hypothetical protein